MNRASESPLAPYTDPASFTKHLFDINIKLAFQFVSYLLRFDLVIDFLHGLLPSIMDINDISYHFDHLGIVVFQTLLDNGIEVELRVSIVFDLVLGEAGILLRCVQGLDLSK